MQSWRLYSSRIVLVELIIITAFVILDSFKLLFVTAKAFYSVPITQYMEVIVMMEKFMAGSTQIIITQLLYCVFGLVAVGLASTTMTVIIVRQLIAITNGVCCPPVSDACPLLVKMPHAACAYNIFASFIMFLSADVFSIHTTDFTPEFVWLASILSVIVYSLIVPNEECDYC